MIGRVIEIASDGRHLSKERGFLVVSHNGQEEGRIALDSLTAVVANAHGLTYSNNLIVALAELNIAFVFCAANHRPAGFLWPADSHHEQGGRIADQAAASKPLKKRLWQQLIQAKIDQQMAALFATGGDANALALMGRKVRAGDPDNIEAQAARIYWPLMLGQAFRRRTDGHGLNGLLNYGYAVLRAGAARGVMAAGLHPGLGVGHVGRGNPFCLVDDVMEPYRPIVDKLVCEYRHEAEAITLTPEIKARLAGILICDMETEQGATPVISCIERMCLSLARCFAGQEKRLWLPRAPLPLVR